MPGTPVPPTEERNPRSAGLDLMDTRRVLEVLNEEDRTVAETVRGALDSLARAADLAADALGRGGRLLYLGAGTSGRLAALDAVEIPPTFGLPPDRVVAILAGGDEALARAVEGAEDDALEAVAEIRNRDVGPADCVVGVTASGSTRFVLGGLGEARERGAACVLVTCAVPAGKSPWDVVVHLPTGAEAVTGSTRLKAGSATKMALNMLSTAAMVRLGRVYDNLMVEVRATNAKLRQRAARIVEIVAGVHPHRAEEALDRCGGEATTAIVALKRQVNAEAARALLKSHGGRLRAALEAPR